MSRYQKLLENLDKLKLTQIKIHLGNYIDKINDENLSVADALYELTEKEIEVKNYNATNAMIKVAGFPYLKELKDFDFDFQQSIKVNFLTLKHLDF